MTITDLEDRIIYESGSVTATLWKDDDNLRFELTAPWPMGEYANWQDYANGIEEAGI